MPWLQRALNYLRSSLSRKFLLAIVCTNLVFVLAIGWELVARERVMLDQERLARVQGITRFLASASELPLRTRDRTDLERLAIAGSSLQIVEGVTFEDEAGRILASAPYPVAHPPSGVLPFRRRKADLEIYQLADDLIGEIDVRSTGRVVGRIRVSVSRGDVVRRQREMALYAAIFGVALIFLAGLIAFLTARSMIERLAKLAQAAQQFRLGNRSARFRDNSPDEVGEVARGLNAMLETIVRTERSLGDVFRVARIGSWIHDPSKPHLELSDTIFEMFGFSREGDSPKLDTFLRYMTLADRMKIGRLLESGEPGDTLTFTMRSHGPRGARRIYWLEARLALSDETGERILSGVCQDVTDRELALEQLRQAQKMEAVGQLTGGLAHDFNNLLAIIIGHLDLLAEASPEGSDERESADEALSAALRGSELTRQLLSFSRRQSLSPQRIELNALIEGMFSLLRRTLGESIEIRTSLTGDLWPTQADPAQVESAILNLVINARDAMPGRGVLTLSTANATLEEDGDRPGDERLPAGEYSVITVSDNGEGMSGEVLDRVFEPFFTTKAVGEGSGLGLSMVYGFARQSGGDVRIYSEKGYGTSVAIYLPRAKSSAAAGAASRKSKAMPMARSEHVLLVEDNESVRKIAERQLRELGYGVATAGNGAEAIARLRQGVRADLLFTDVVMPGAIDGFELARLARECRPGIRILHTSGFAGPALLGCGNEGAPISILAKPYRKLDLALKIRQVLDQPGGGERPAGPALDGSTST